MNTFEDRLAYYSKEHMSNEYEWLADQIRQRGHFLEELKIEIDNLDRNSHIQGGSVFQLRKQYLDTIYNEQQLLLTYFVSCRNVLVSMIRIRMNPGYEHLN